MGHILKFPTAPRKDPRQALIGLLLSFSGGQQLGLALLLPDLYGIKTTRPDDAATARAVLMLLVIRLGDGDVLDCLNRVEILMYPIDSVATQ